MSVIQVNVWTCDLIAGFWLGLKAAAWVVRKHMEIDQ